MSETDIVARLREIVQGMPHTDRVNDQRITRDVRVLLRAAASDLSRMREALAAVERYITLHLRPLAIGEPDPLTSIRAALSPAAEPKMETGQ